MDQNAFAALVAAKVAQDTQLASAVIGLAGVVVGALVTGLLNLFAEHLKTHRAKKLDEARKRLLLKLLNSEKHKWRTLQTLSDVIGADESDTLRLLIEVGARGSTSSKLVWGLISRNPLDDTPE